MARDRLCGILYFSYHVELFTKFNVRSSTKSLYSVLENCRMSSSTEATWERRWAGLIMRKFWSSPWECDFYFRKLIRCLIFCRLKFFQYQDIKTMKQFKSMVSSSNQFIGAQLTLNWTSTLVTTLMSNTFLWLLLFQFDTKSCTSTSISLYLSKHLPEIIAHFSHCYIDNNCLSSQCWLKWTCIILLKQTEPISSYPLSQYCASMFAGSYTSTLIWKSS